MRQLILSTRVARSSSPVLRFFVGSPSPRKRTVNERAKGENVIGPRRRQPADRPRAPRCCVSSCSSPRSASSLTLIAQVRRHLCCLRHRSAPVPVPRARLAPRQPIDPAAFSSRFPRVTLPDAGPRRPSSASSINNGRNRLLPPGRAPAEKTCSSYLVT